MTWENFYKWITDLKGKKWLPAAILLVVVSLTIFLIWQRHLNSEKKNIVSGNGRIEATEIDIAPRVSARVKEILVHEGDYVTAGEVLVYMDTDVLEAQLKEVQGKLLQANHFVAVQQSTLMQRKSEKIVAEAMLRQREAELEVAEKRWNRSAKLVSEGATSQQTADDDWATYKSAIAAKEAARAQIGAADAAVVTAQEQVNGAESAVEASKGTVQRIQADIKDSELKTPRDGRIQYRIAQPGEVVNAGSPVLILTDLSDVYITFFLPTAIVGRIKIGEEARLILDVAPEFVIPAVISFVSDVAQFTPKTVETAAEREKFMFRVKARIPKEVLKKYITYVKTGMPGEVYIRLDTSKPWPNKLKVSI
jgi:HlyD family secretion protein